MVGLLDRGDFVAVFLYHRKLLRNFPMIQKPSGRIAHFFPRGGRYAKNENKNNMARKSAASEEKHE